MLAQFIFSQLELAEPEQSTLEPNFACLWLQEPKT
jgi:hypothetical protein